MEKRRKIIAVSGARSDYDLLYSVYSKLNEDSSIEFKIIITGPNLSENYGYTAQNIENDNFKIAGKIFNLIDSSQKIGRISSIGFQIPILATLLSEEKPDIVIVAGDREEAISVTMTCAYLDIPVAHFFGGDIAKDGNIDNSVRYAASKFAHIHFPTLEEHRNTLLKLGEDDWRIFPIGNPALDRLGNIPIMKNEDVFANIGAGNKKINNYSVLIQHPIITQVEEQSKHIKITLEALLSTEGHCFLNYPNSDAGNSDIIVAYQEYSKKYSDKFTLFKNLDRNNYINLLRGADFLIGNSSSGIVEVASLGLAVINVGERQRGRLHGENVIFVDNDIVQIKNAIEKARNDSEFQKIVAQKNNPYGEGKSADKAVQILKEIEINNKLIYKNITY